jgi:hypothetical protein
MKQVEIDFSQRITEAHIQIAEDHANAVHPNWSESAFEYLKVYLSHTRSQFMVEDFREAAQQVIPTPPSLRAYGAVILKAAKAGLVRKVGYGKVRNIRAHRTPATLWQKC